MKLLIKILLYTLLLPVYSASAYNSMERIPMDHIVMPAHDLLLQTGEKLGPEKLWQLSNDLIKPLDLSTLSPHESAVWKDQLGTQLSYGVDFLAPAEDEVVSFSGTLLSAPEQMRFNVISSSDKEFYTIVLNKSLHTMLMRKNLLRKLGYIIPKTDYRRSIKVRFANIEEMDQFQKQTLPKATLGASERWVTDRNEQTFTLTLQDIALMKPSETDHFNFAMGVVPKNHVQRTIRSLIVPYALLNVKESINQVPWSVGRLDNKHYLLPHFAIGGLSPSIHDVKWALRRLEKLSREELAQVVKFSYYPMAVEKLLIEKVIARRNSLLKLFNIDHKPYSYNVNISYKETLKEGKINLENWQGYASRFAFGNPESPFDDVQSNVLTELQRESFNYATSRLAEELVAFDLTDARQAYFEEQFKVGLEEFVETGNLIQFGVGAWYTPVLNGNLILNRSIVLGSYQGSDNIVQLADTFGYAVEVGAHVGIEGLSEKVGGAFARGGVSYLKTFTHLKPVNSLRNSLKEPYKKLFVPLVKRILRTTADDLAQLTSDIRAKQIDNEERDLVLSESQQERFEELYAQLNEFLGVGESLIISRKIIPRLSSGLTLADINAALSISTSADATFIKRLHLYRSSENEIQIYDDIGSSIGGSLSFGLGSNGMNILRFNTSKSLGKYEVNFHKVSIANGLANNDDFSMNALALAKVLKDGDVDLLNEVAPSHKVKARYKQGLNRTKFLFLVDQRLKGHNKIEFTDTEGHKSQYLTVERQKQQGVNLQVFVTEIANYYLRKNENDFSFATDTYKNPAFTFFGSSNTVNSRFEARFDLGNVTKPFISISTSAQGWKVKRNKLQRKLKNINKRFSRTLFNENTLQDVSAMRVYNATVNLNLYEAGVESLKNISSQQVSLLERRYKSKYNCDSDHQKFRSFECGDLSDVKRVLRRCHKRGIDQIKKNTCFLELASVMKEQVDFNDFATLLGEDNYYLYGVVTGFRSDSEILFEPELANGYGKIGSRFTEGPVQQLMRIIGIQNGEFNGNWIRTLL